MEGEISFGNVEFQNENFLREKFFDVLGRILPAGPAGAGEGFNYKIQFFRPVFGTSVACLIQIVGQTDIWIAKAKSANAEKSFLRALGSLRSLVLNLDHFKREESDGVIGAGGFENESALAA
jgi:hypothetical protein